MRAVLGVVGLLLAVAIVALLARNQLRAVQSVPASASAAGVAGSSSQAPANVREQSQQLQRKVAEDVANALSQGAARASDPVQ